MIEFAWGTATDVGQVRQNNQDQMLTAPPVFVVADGMGGHNGGEVASAIAVDEMAKAQGVASVDDLIDAVQMANREIVDRSKIEPELRGMGTTLVALVGMMVGDRQRIGVANVGDSRLYRATDEELVQLTEDHTLVETLVRDGRLTAEEALTHPQRNIVTRALGIDEKVLVDTWELAPVPGDRFVLCSDGLFDELREPEILEILQREEDPSDAALELVRGAVQAGGRDNVTALVVDVTAADSVDDEIPDDRIVSIHKAVPDSVLRLDPPPETGPNDPHPDEILVDRTIEKPPFVTWRLGLFVAAVLLVLGVLLSSVVAYARSAYFVGIDGEEVVIYRGRPDGVLWFDPTVEEQVVLTVSELDPEDLPDVIEGVEFDELDDARDYAAALTERSLIDDP
ncbi:MAG: Stp1/IreP family PP2C-type Ser/Thr phosphatase [Acidimicrobiales bacterium]|nr:Stp1/IreP family PP2C-type Ser/Thr phosphatase [Acidimicrobiales bacterium]